VIGYLSWRDVFQRVWSGESPDVEELVRPVHLVPETMPATDLLRELLRRRQQLAVVVDEHGGVAGIVTLEDLLEELVGEIDSEHDPATERIWPADDGTARVLGDATLRDVNRALGTALQEPLEGTTVNALLVELAGDRIPQVGETFAGGDGTRLEVLEASPRRVRQVRLRPAPRLEPEA
jgi:putative hemolysin